MARKPDETVRLDVAIEMFFDALKPEKLAEATLRSKERTLAALTEATGRVNRTTRKLTNEHFVWTLTMLANGATPEENERRRLKGMPPRIGRKPVSLQQDRSTLNQFVDFLKHRKLVRASFDPLYRVTISSRDNGDANPDRVFKRRSVPMEEWPALLDAAGSHHARTRMAVACGIFFGRRASEVAHIKIKHLSADRASIELYNLKRGRPTHAGGLLISPWMRAELDAYLRWYESQYGPLQGDWHLCPAKMLMVEVGPLQDPQTWPMRPANQATPDAIISDVREALSLHGWTKDMLYREGVHTLRRSAAIATEAAEGIAAAQALMDHASPNQTLVYTGNRAGKAAMDRALAAMVPPTPEPDPAPATSLAPVFIPAQPQAPEREHAAPVVDLFSRRRIA